jgi:glucose-6-phosphate isomerase
MMSLRFDYTNVSTHVLGSAHGLEIDSLFKHEADRVAQAVKNLFAKRHQEGGWCKWLNLGQQQALCDNIQAYAATQQGQVDDVVVLGIGGSSLGPIALFKALLHPFWNNLSKEQRQGLPHFHVIDNVDADVMAGLFDILDLKRTLVNVISKSGTTAETMAAFMTLKAKLEAAVGSDLLNKHLVFTTDKNVGLLRELATTLNVTCFEVPDDVGGRFSVFSAVGLLPAALCGIDIQALQQGIRDIEPLLANPNIQQNPAAQNALIQTTYLNRGKPISVFMPYSTRLAYVADWYVQLWAESLGKADNLNGEKVNVGPTPLKAVGATDQHSQIQLYNEGPFDKITTFVQVETPDHNTVIENSVPNVTKLSYLANQPFHKLMTSEFLATRASLTKNQRPNVTITLPRVDAYSVAQLLFMLEVQTGIAGELLNIDPFNQPGVELAKQYTHALMGSDGYQHLLADMQLKPSV